MLDKIRNMQEKVANMLHKYADLRDDDQKLVTNIWYIEMRKFGNPDTMPATDFLALYQQGKLPTADLITRARRKVQEENPALRGNTWEERHNQSKKIKKNI